MSVFTALASSKIAAGAAAFGALTVGGVGTAAYSGALPADAQRAAHQIIGAPAPKQVQDVQDTAVQKAAAAQSNGAQAAGAATSAASSAASGAGQAVGPASKAAPASGAADLDVLGLCTASVHGGLDAASAAYKSLVVAANGEAHVAAYCQGILGASAQGTSGADASLAPGLPATPSVPAVPSVPGEAALPSAPSVPSSVPAPPTSVPTLPAGVQPGAHQ